MASQSGSAAGRRRVIGTPAANDRGHNDQIGEHLKALRAARGMTLDRLAAATGLTKSYLSKIQNSHKVPPIATLSRIAQALGTGIGSFFGDILEPGEGVTVVREHERLPVVRGGTAFGYDYVSLAHDRRGKHMEPFVFTFPSKLDRHVFFDHGGEEFVFILSGKVIFQVGDERWALEKGDSIYFDAAIPHRGWSVGRDATALVVIYAPAEQRDTPPRGSDRRKPRR